jgi:hypothetical protein
MAFEKYDESQKLEPTTTHKAMWMDIASLVSGNIRDIAKEKIELFSRAEANATIGHYAMTKGYNSQDDVYDYV